MQTLQRASFKNSCLFQMQITLGDIKAWAYNSIIKGIPKDFRIFTNKIIDAMYLFLYHTFCLHFPETIK